MEFLVISYLAVFYFVALAPKGTLSNVFVIYGYGIAVILLASIPPLGIGLIIFVWLCQRLRKRKDKGKSLLPYFDRARRDHRLAKKKARKAMREVDKEHVQALEENISDKKIQLQEQEERIRKLLEENEQLKKKQLEERRFSEATPRLRHYRELTKKRLENEDIELEKIKRKRLEEEMKRLKNLNK